jgi:hypothetical protein
MGHDLPHLVRATYASAVLSRRDPAAAFEKAVEMVLRRRPLLGEEEARREVAEMLAADPLGSEAGSASETP